MTEAVIYIAWDETGEYAADIDEDEAIDRLDGNCKRVLSLTVNLPEPRRIKMRLDVHDDESTPSLRSVK